MKGHVGLAAAFAAAALVCSGQSTSSQENTSQSTSSQDQTSQQGSSKRGRSQRDRSGTETSKAENQSAHRATTDTNFVTRAAQAGMAEVELGNLAQEKASSQAVKDFAQRMVTDHTKANDELKQIAEQKNITVPSSLDPQHQAMKDRLSKLSGAEFDRAYMSSMTRDHRTAVQEFERESRHGQDPELKAFASKTLPILEEHHKMAEQTRSQEKK